MRRRILPPLFAVCAALLLGRTVRAGDAEGEAAAGLLRALARGSNAFGDDLLTALARSPGNVVFSPHSIRSALAAVREGAVGESRRRLGRALRLGEGLPTDGQRWLADALAPEAAGRSAAPYRLTTVTALWAAVAEPPAAAFLARVRERHRAHVGLLDFGKGEFSRSIINTWVERSTQGEVVDLVPRGSPSPDDALILTTAMAFEADWNAPFRASDTVPHPFTRGDRTQVAVPMLAGVRVLAYAEATGAQVAEIPYAGGATYLLVALPPSHLPPEDLPAAVWGLPREPVRVDLRLPRLDLRAMVDVATSLRAIGVDLAAADLSGISDRAFVSSVIHEATLRWNEKGTKAAAATAVVVTRGGAHGDDEDVYFHADRPFLFRIVHRATGLVLFTGRVADPSAR